MSGPCSGTMTGGGIPCLVIRGSDDPCETGRQAGRQALSSF